MNQPKLPWNEFVSILSKKTSPVFVEVMRDAFIKADDHLFNLSQISTSHMEALRILRHNRNQLLESWGQFYTESFVKWGEGNGSSAFARELTLISDDELEEKLALDQMAAAFTKMHAKSLHDMEPMWKSICAQASSQYKDVTIESCPFLPNGLSQSIGKWLAKLEIELASRVVLLKIMEREINKGLHKIYDLGLSLALEYQWREATAQDRMSDRSTGTKSHVRHDETDHSNHPSQQHASQQHASSHSHAQDFQGFQPLKPLIADDVDPNDMSYMIQQLLDEEGAAFQMPPALIPPGHGGHQMSMAPSQHTSSGRGYHVPHRYVVPQHEIPDHFSTQNAQAFASALQKLLDGDGVPTQDYQLSKEEWDPEIENLVRALNSKRANSTKPMRLSVMPREQVKTVLNEMQQDVAPSLQEAAKKSNDLAEIFKQEILNKGRKLGLVDQEELDEKDEDAVDIVGMLFEVFLSERNLEDGMKEKMAKMIAPYVKVALDDRKLFMQKQHPARRLLDVMAEACEGNTGGTMYEKEALDKVAKGIDLLAANYREDTAAFELIENELRSFIDQQKARISLAEKRAAEAQKGRERLEKSRSISEQEFQQKTTGLNWPVKSLELIKKYWCPHHSLIFLRHEEETHVLNDSLSLLDTFIHIGVEGLSKLPESASEIHKKMIMMFKTSGLVDQPAQDVAMELWTALEEAHQWSEFHKQQQERLVENTRAENEKIAQQKKAGEEASQLQSNQVQPDRHHIETSGVLIHSEIDPINLVPYELPDPQVANDEVVVVNKEERPHLELVSSKPHVPAEIVSHFKDMRVGTWVDFIKEDGSVVPAKMSWISPISQRLLFVNRRGVQYAVESAEDLALMVVRGLLRIRNVGLGEKAFETSYRQAVEKIQSSVILAQPPQEG